MSAMLSMENLTGARVLILGASRSGLAAARLLHDAGARIWVSELRPRERVEAAAAELDSLNIPLETGGHRLEKVPKPQFVVLSPGIPKSAAVVDGLMKRGIPVISELELASWFFTGTLIAVTGSNGKTTVVRWLEHMLREAGILAHACGNVGYAFSDMIREQQGITHAVVETSSYQLESIHRFQPDVSMITNISDDHRERHGTMENYAATKARIFENQDKDDWAVLPTGDELVASVSVAIRPQVAQVAMDHVPALGAGLDDGALHLHLGKTPERLLHADELPIPGHHNVANALCAAVTGRILKLTPDEIIAGLKSFRGVPHRLENVGENGRRWINDSKATNVDSLKVALDATPGPIVLIAGGRDKGAPYESLRELVKAKVARLLLIGEGAARLHAELGDLVPAETVGDLPAAVARAREIAEPGQSVLLSPGCASFDQFTDFEARGDAFRELVRTTVLNGEGDA